VSPHGGAPRIEWRNEFAMLVRTAPIQQALSPSIPYFRRSGAGILVGQPAVFNACGFGFFFPLPSAGVVLVRSQDDAMG